MEAKTKEVLAMLDDVLSQTDPQGTKVAVEVWDVITALRGPDNFRAALKNSLTVPIRRAALPKTTRVAEAADRLPAWSAGPIEGRAMFEPMGGARLEGNTIEERLDNSANYYAGALSHADGHYVGHARSAARVLGI